MNTVDELIEAIDAMVLNLQWLPEQLEQAVRHEAPALVARGFVVDTMNVGPIRQWIYVIRTHVTAMPARLTYYSTKAEIESYARYLDYLIAQVLSDVRFVREINLSWSKAWVLSGSEMWRKVVDAATILNEQVPVVPQRVLFLQDVLSLQQSRMAPKD